MEVRDLEVRVELVSCNLMLSFQTFLKIEPELFKPEMEKRADGADASVLFSPRLC